MVSRLAIANVMKNVPAAGKRKAVEGLIKNLPVEEQQKILSDLESYPEYGKVPIIDVPVVISKASYNAEG